MFKIISKFKFTRTEKKDYHFEYAPLNCNNVLEKIQYLQDYFGCLVNNEGYYSFKEDNFWVCAITKKEEKKDNVGRPIFSIIGIIIPIAELNDEWLKYFVSKKNTINEKIKTFPGEYKANLNNLEQFSNNVLIEKPLAWAWGVKSKENEINDLIFQYRFTINSERNLIAENQKTEKEAFNSIIRKEKIINQRSKKDITSIGYLTYKENLNLETFCKTQKSIDKIININSEESFSFNHIKYIDILFSFTNISCENYLKNNQMESLWIVIDSLDFESLSKNIAYNASLFLDKNNLKNKSIKIIIYMKDFFLKKNLFFKFEYDKKRISERCETYKKKILFYLEGYKNYSLYIIPIGIINQRKEILYQFDLPFEIEFYEYIYEKIHTEKNILLKQKHMYNFQKIAQIIKKRTYKSVYFINRMEKNNEIMRRRVL